ncbi:sensor histidine kinase [Paractinoplanes rishiriensis]|uniref:histidine kinase n=1 Tax=Paractinoplanes rishiriensis TaxID=1050105 RepID=A0A919N129_9ACTN|nr:histidine kinase [Actinoplanes rishiriensis]GIF00431.1 two-component sensor histidine kinase [Actinoplanes rishiriensis]
MPNAATTLRAAARRPLPYTWRDWALAALVLTVLVFDVAFRDLVWRPAAVAFGCGLALAVLVRRAHPLAAVVYAFGGFAVLDVAAFVVGTEPVDLHSGWVVLVLLYALLRWRAGREVAIGMAVTAVALTAIVSVDFPGLAETTAGIAMVLLAAALGASVRYRTIARGQLIVQAKLQEREQLARELHDTVAHHVSAIAIQAQAGLFLARSSSLSGATEALETINREAARTLAEMRAMVSALRDRRQQPSLVPQRRIADIEGLAADSTEALRIGVELRGDLTDLPPAVEGALYRVTQESITNAQRHAQHATRVRVEVTGSATDVQLTVSDDGARIASAAGPPGFGLAGMTERITLLGGTLNAGPNPDRGWIVRAVLPRRGAAT